MDTPSPLCRPCRQILEKLLQQRGEGDNRIRDHHFTCKRLTEAVQSRCYICTISWDSFLSWRTTTEENETWRTSYSLGRGELEEGLNIFSIYVRKERGWHCVRFSLIDAQSSKHRQLFLPRTLAPNTSSQSSLGLAYGWYNSCRALHKSCRQLLTIPKWYPTRLVDIGRLGDLSWKLHICADEAMLSPNYMTLSYRWADSSPWKLTQANINELRLGKLIDELPQTFQDAMTVARRFSIRYLWVDSLCIIQDSKEDWERESSTMRHVYANSSCNICATASSNPSEGLFRARQNNIIQPGLMIMKTDSTTNKYYIINNGYWDSQVTRTVLNKRGWVFQERLLAPRILHFARHQLFWECFTENKCEVYPVGIPLHRPLKSFKPIFTEATQKEGALSMDALCLWHRLIKEYTNCALTRSSDRLAALAGLARLFQDATGDEYLYGLWRSRLAESMHWQPLSPMTKHSCEYLSPSWSWASGIGSVTISAPDSHFITVLDARSHSSSFDITGQLLRGFIKIKGPVVRATCVENVRPILVSRRTTSKVYQLRLEVWPPESDDMTHFGSSRQLFIAPPKPSPGLITAALFQDFQSTKFDVGRSMLLLGVCVPLFDKVVEPHLKGLILEHTSSSSDLFVRIGTFEIRGKDRMEEFGVCVNSENKSCWLNEGVKRAVITIV